MSDLIKRVESATGPDRALDFDIKQALEPSTTFIAWKDFPPRDGDYIDPRTKASEFARFQGDSVIVPHYTASLDAAIALCARALPGWRFTSVAYEPDADAERPWGALVSEHGTNDLHRLVPAIAPTPALALVLAILRAHPDGGSDA